MFLSEVSDTSTLDFDFEDRPLYVSLNDSNGILEFNGRTMQPNEFVVGVTGADAQEELLEAASAISESDEEEAHEGHSVNRVLAVVSDVRD